MSYASKVFEIALSKNIIIATAESCTGGLISSSIIDISGSSAIFDRGYVTYSNEAKTSILGINKELIDKYGAVSEEVASAMAHSTVNKIKPTKHALAVSVSGVAGPNGGTAAKPVGFVCFGIAYRCDDNIISRTESTNFNGSRNEIRKLAAEHALKMLLKQLNEI